MEITIADIVKEFGEAAALRGVSLQVRAGELMALLGPSGSGKTTLLRVIAGLEIPDAGHVLFGGEDATGLPVQKRQVGFVFQHYALFKHLSVFDNIAYGLRARERKRRPSEGEIRKRVLALLDLVQLAGIDKRFPLQLSGGQRQRVALARALAVEPRVLLLDEPFGALDAKVRKDLRRWLRDIHDRTGQTTVFVTHDQDEALELADRVAILCNGRVEQVGPPEIVYDQPSSPFVMSFVGETARLPVTVVGGGARLAGKPIGVIVRGVKDGPTDLFLRPWEIAIGPEHPGRLNGIVKTMRRSGQKNRLAVLVEATDVLLDIDVPLESAAKTGDVVSIQILRGRVFPDRAKGGAR